MTGRSDAEQHLTIDVLINSRGPFRFVVDTGADRTVIADDVAQRLALPGSQRVLVEGIVRTIPAGTVLVGSLSFGPVAHENLQMPVLPRTLLGADGYLGLDAVNGYCVTFDFLKRELNIEYSRFSRDTRVISPSFTRIPADGTAGHLKSVNCDVDGVRATAFIDSGAQASIGNASLAAALSASGNRHVELGKVPVTGVTGGSLEGRVTAIDHIRFKTLTFEAKSIVIADLQVFDLWGLSQTPAVLIGMNYLRRFAQVSVDYRLEEFRFELADRALLGAA